jgi:hypothetical protein
VVKGHSKSNPPEYQRAGSKKGNKSDEGRKCERKRPRVRRDGKVLEIKYNY